MPIQGLVEYEDRIEVNLSGTISNAELKQILSQLGLKEPRIKKNVLIKLHGFNGWSHEADEWSDISTTEATDPYILKMAIIGDLKWKDSFEMFVMKGLRPFPIEYFPVEQEELAKAWLE